MRVAPLSDSHSRPQNVIAGESRAMAAKTSTRRDWKSGRSRARSGATQKTASNTDQVVAIVDQLSHAMSAAINEIRDINENAKLLALNARIEAARAGGNGAAFGVVAQEMQGLSTKTALVADEMANKTRESISVLVDLIGGNVRGTRLADLALNNIDLMDRNLYERTCDVRWWATDASIVTALEDGSTQAASYASSRMGVILNAYTVYLDLVLCDLDGRIIANGRPNMFQSAGRRESNSEWFLHAMSTSSGDEYGFQSSHESSLVGNRRALIYSCAVREGGNVHGRPIGVLGVVFDWETFSNAILNGKIYESSEFANTLRLITDDHGNVMASSRQLADSYRFPVDRYIELFRSPRDYTIDIVENRKVCIGHAISPGFETYRTGWHSLLIQDLD